MNTPKIIEIQEKKLIGARIKCSMENDKTGVLWQNFMPKRKQIPNRLDENYYSIHIYDGGLNIDTFTKETVFEKWAAVAVTEFGDIPEGMEPFVLKSGKYATLIHHGLASDFPKTLKYIYETWLPQSGYQLDSRPHFEIMGDKYFGPSDANSEEEVWVPIK